LRITLKFDGLNTADGEFLPVDVKAEITLTGNGPSVTATQRSTISINLMRSLRHVLEAEGYQLPSEDDAGKNTVCGGWDPAVYASFRETQTDLLQQALAVIFSLFEHPRTTLTLTVRTLEICYDNDGVDPEAAVHAIGGLPNPWTRSTAITPFRPTATTLDVGNKQVVRWEDSRTANKQHYKFYPKGETVRCEIAYLSSQAVARALGESKVVRLSRPQDGEELLETFAEVANPALQEMRGLASDHAEAQLDPAQVKGLCDLISALISLFDSPQHGRGRPRARETIQQAERVLRCLLLNGRFDAYGKNLPGMVRRLLEEAVENGVLRRSGERKLLFSVVPQLNGLRLQLARRGIGKSS
jgi:hypothetical protein